MEWGQINSLKISYAKQMEGRKAHIEVSYMGQREERSKNDKKASSGLNANAYENQRKMRFVMSNQGHSQMSEHYKCARFRLGQRTEKAWRKTPAFCFLSLIQFESSQGLQGKKLSATCQGFLVFLMTA